MHENPYLGLDAKAILLAAKNEDLMIDALDLYSRWELGIKDDDLSPDEIVALSQVKRHREIETAEMQAHIIAHSLAKVFQAR
jgi:hypothetical protein